MTNAVHICEPTEFTLYYTVLSVEELFVGTGCTFGSRFIASGTIGVASFTLGNDEVVAIETSDAMNWRVVFPTSGASFVATEEGDI